MGLSQVGLPTRTKVDPAVRRPLDLAARLREYAPGRPRVVRMPSDWWDSPAVAACPLNTGVQSGRAARKFTRNTLKEWGLVTLADDHLGVIRKRDQAPLLQGVPGEAPGGPAGLGVGPERARGYGGGIPPVGRHPDHARTSRRALQPRGQVEGPTHGRVNLGAYRQTYLAQAHRDPAKLETAIPDD